MKDHSFFIAMSYGALAVVVLIEAWMLLQQRRAAIHARALEKVLNPQEPGYTAMLLEEPATASRRPESQIAPADSHAPGHAPVQQRQEHPR